jgi:hypothetical protein
VSVPRFAAFLLLTIAGPAVARDRVALIEFFGYQGLDVEAVRRALPVREGDPYNDTVKQGVRAAVKRAIGRDATDVAAICCDEHGDRVLFIGLPGPSSRSFRPNPAPAGAVRLSKEAIELYARLDEAEQAAIGEGKAEEDPSRGYRLLRYPPARKLELEFRRYALGHEPEMTDVLEHCSDPEQRAIAADALGFARRSPAQVAALVRSCRDPDDEVRNNSTRALGEILSADPVLARQVRADVFLEMIGSGVWTDRNKAAFVLGVLARYNDPQLRERIRSEGWAPLMEMALWRDTGHAFGPRLLLGRIANLPEDRLMKVASGPPAHFLEAIGTR